MFAARISDVPLMCLFIKFKGIYMTLLSVLNLGLVLFLLRAHSMNTFSIIKWYLTSVDFLENAMKMLQSLIH